jgi:hypothetical protein
MLLSETVGANLAVCFCCTLCVLLLLLLLLLLSTLCFSWSCGTCSGYGGALSLFFGLSSGLQTLKVSYIDILLHSNVFVNCMASVSASGGNAYGGAVSLYIGAYSSTYNLSGDAAAAVGDTLVNGVRVSLKSSKFMSCIARRQNSHSQSANGANVYGGSFSFYIGSYAWSQSIASSSSTCGATNVNNVTVVVQNSTSFNCRASTSVEALIDSNTISSRGANSIGGSLSVLFIGAYSFSLSSGASSSSSSTCGAVLASDIEVHINGSDCTDCIAESLTQGSSYGANVYGGSMSVLFIGSYSWSLLLGSFGYSSSRCGATTASAIILQVSNSKCINSSAVSATVGTNSSVSSRGANSYGGSMSLLYAGAYSFSWSDSSFSSISSTCDETIMNDMDIRVQNVTSLNSKAVTVTNVSTSRAANSYGGSMSLFYAGAFSWTRNNDASSNSTSSCGATSVSSVFVHVSDWHCENCSAESSTGTRSYGANVYGGSMSLLFIGAYSGSWSDTVSSNSSSSCGITNVSSVNASVQNSTSFNSRAVTTTDSDSSNGANAYGGSINAAYIGAYAYSYALGAYKYNCSSIALATHVHHLLIKIENSNISESLALSSEFSSCFFDFRCADIISNFRNKHKFIWLAREFVGIKPSNAILIFFWSGLRWRNQCHGWALCEIDNRSWEFFRIVRRHCVRQLWSRHRAHDDLKQCCVVKHYR